MNISRYISSKIGGSGGDSFTSSVTKIAIISIAVGLAIMIVSFAILQGFRNEIQRKIFSFGAHLQISKYDTNNSFEGKPINTNSVVKNLKGIPDIQHYQPYAFKTAIIKTDEEVYGVVLKGVDTSYDFKPMQQNLVAGKIISFSDTAASNDIMISSQIANKLRIKLGDKVSFFFIQNPPRARRFQVKGIFKTGLEEFDQVYVLSDMQHIRDLNKWSDTVATGYEIMLKDFNKIDTVASTVFNRMNYDLQLEKVTDQYAQLFDWMKLLNQNVIIFLILIIFVATFNMVSSVFIMILERTNMIGLLKAVGATDPQIQKVFFYKGLQLTLRGLVYGNLIGLGFCAFQYFTRIIPLDPENYYMDTVPIAWSPGIIIILNVVTLALTMLAIMMPTYMIAKIKPVAAIKFD